MKRKKTNRREFIRKATGVAVGALAFPNIVPSSVLGKGMAPPSERVNMGFIGLGGQGSGHLMGGAWTYVPGGYIARDDVQVMAVCDVRRGRREHAWKRCNQIYAERFGQPEYDGVKAYNDFREVLARTDIDAVLLALPYHWAATMSIMAMRAGKDVYCEKPVAITVRETQAIVETARRYGRVYQAGTQQRSEYEGKFRLTCDLVRNRRIGQLKEVYAFGPPGAFAPKPWTSNNSEPIPEGLDWDRWLGPLPWRPYGGHAGHTLPGLFVGDINWSPHRYDIVQWTVNPDPSAPVEVEYENDNIHYHYENGVTVHSSAYPGESVGAVGGACFVGTDGRVAVDRVNIVSNPGNILKEPLRSDDERVYYSNSHSGNFLDCVRNRKATICNPEVAACSMNTILIGGISLALKQSLNWAPAKPQFIVNEKANRLLSYTPRSPWFI